MQVTRPPSPYASLVRRTRPGMLGTASTDAWGAVLTSAKDRNFGTSKQDVDNYAAAYGSVTAASACAATPGLEALAPVCAEGGAIIAAYAADVIQTIGASLFGGSDFKPQPNDVWNPIADAAIRSVVKALRVKKGEEVSNPPGGSFRNYPEWKAVALLWAQNVNAYVAAKGGPIKWFYDAPGDANPGRIRQAAIDQWFKCGGYWQKDDPAAWGPGQWTYPPAAQCKTPSGESASAPLPAAIATGTQQTMLAALGVPFTNHYVARDSGSSSTAGIVTKVAAAGGVAWLAWKFLLPRFL